MSVYLASLERERDESWYGICESRVYVYAFEYLEHWCDWRRGSKKKRWGRKFPDFSNDKHMLDMPDIRDKSQYIREQKKKCAA